MTIHFLKIAGKATGLLGGVLLLAGVAHGQILYFSDGDHVGNYNFATTSAQGSFISQIDATGVAVGSDHNVYVGTSSSAPTLGAGAGVVAFNGSTGTQVGSGAFVPFTGTPANNVNGPEGMRFDALGNLYIADVTNSEVHVYDSTGNSLGTITGDNLSQPYDVAFDGNGNLYVSGALGIGVSIGATQPFVDFVSAGTAAGVGMNSPVGMAFGPDGKLYVADSQSDKIFRFNANGTFSDVFADLDSATGGIFVPAYLTFDSANSLYVSGTDISGPGGEIIGFQNGTYGGVLVSGLVNPRSLAVAVPEPTVWVLPASVAVAVLMARRRCRA